MLDSETKRRIDNARDILVGKIPDPKSQIEQITIALIYKFMDDMDKKSEELGGKAKFFTGDYNKYSWSKILDASVSGPELVNTYGEAIASMNQNPNLPQLFRDIFKNAYLPYRDPQTLKSFLRIIDDFSYDHSERLGDAFEYLLSVMGSQGDAGQFRTPRHIIEFIVDVVNPTINDTIFDPACGTAGFLISAYKHILEKHTKDGKNSLTGSERKKLAENIVGYDISPDMVRLSLVNLYLHGFKNPKISEYDTLTSEDKWDEEFDVALANPPFMTPKGGIRPHKRFGVTSNRAEVLFVDYMNEHLNIDGRAGIVVPEGIIFQSGKSYQSLRKSLILNSLYAVVSLPAGVFNPYSGVKTSVLFLDKRIAKKTSDVLFIKVEADGYNLGAQRREIKDNDLPLALEMLEHYQSKILLGEEVSLEKFEKVIGHIVSKDKIKDNDWNLSGDRYKEEVVYDGDWDLVELGTKAEITSSKRIFQKEYVSKGIPFYRTKEIVQLNKGKKISQELFISKERYEEIKSQFNVPKKGEILLSAVGTIGISWVISDNREFYFKDGNLVWIKNIQDIDPYFLKLILDHIFSCNLNTLVFGAAYKALTIVKLKKLKIPLPPLEIQERIVEEIENYQNIIDGAKKVVKSYKPSFKIDKDWDVVVLGEVCELLGGGTPSRKINEYWENGTIDWVTCSDFVNNNIYLSNSIRKITKEGLKNSSSNLIEKGTLILVTRVSLGKMGFTIKETAINQDLTSLNFDKLKINKFFGYYFLQSISSKIKQDGGGVTVKGVSREYVKRIKIPLPSLSIQKEIVARIEEEQKLVDSNKKLIELFEKKVKDKIGEVWGE